MLKFTYLSHLLSLDTRSVGGRNAPGKNKIYFSYKGLF